MLELEGYKPLERIYSGSYSDIYTAVRLADNRSVIIKISNENNFLTSKRRHAFYQEFSLGSAVKSPYVIEYIDAITIGYRVALIEEEGGIGLNNLIRMGGVDLSEFLTIAQQICLGVQAIHERGIIHKDLKPTNILINPQNNHIKIIDFGLSSRLKEEHQDPVFTRHITGSLHYMSPEQTGRMNRSIDFRTDFYSLGITLYQLLTGKLPFASKDILEILHCHLAGKIIPPHELNKNIPLVVSNIIMKLLAKNAEDRYQSADGIYDDISKCIELFHPPNEIPVFELGLTDYPFIFRVSEKLYGRENETNELISSFKRACHGNREVLMITGSAGAGKTYLTQEISKPVTAKRSHYIHGKFDQLAKNIAYSAIISAFQSLIKQLLGESEEHLAVWRNKLVHALGGNGKLITTPLPELEYIIGKKPDLPEVSSIENQNRFNQTFLDFIKVFCNEDQPLVLFLDDLQWADLSSLQLIKLILEDEELKYFMLIGAYRDNEVGVDHPTQHLLNQLAQVVAINTITLTDLQQADINNWVADTLRRKPEETLELTSEIIKKTEGNPFFIKTFFSILHDENCIQFVAGRWEWDINKIRNEPAMANVVTIMLRKMESLPPHLLHLLKIASCLGNTFTTNQLNIILLKDMDTLYDDLVELCNSGFIIHHGEKYAFAHDRIQEAAYKIMSLEEQQETHLSIGRTLWQKSSEPLSDEILYTIVDHCNKGASLIFEEDEELLLAKLNLNAAKAAKSSIAYATAINYLETGLDYLRGKDAWYQHYTLTFQLYFEQAETEYLNGEVDKSTATIQKMLRYVQDPCDVASVNNLLIIQKTMQANYEEAIEIARNTLRLFQVDLAKENIDLALQAEIVDFKSLLNEVSIESIFRLEEMTDREQRAIMKVLYNVLATCYIYNPILYALVGIMMASLSLKYGRNSTESCVGYSCYGMVACNLLNDFKTGLEFAQLSIRLSDKFHDPIQKARACTVLGLLVNHWVKPLKESEQILDEGYQEGVKAGELQFSGYLLFGKAIILFYSGVSLKQSLVEVEKYIAYAKKTKNQITINAIQAIHFAMEGLITRPTENNQQFIEDCLMHRSYVALCCYYIATAQLEYMYDNIRGALEAIGMAQKYLPNALGFFFASLYGWWHSLILLKQYPQVSSDEQENILQIIGSYQKQMQQWAASCPQNFIFRELLIEAELCSIKRQYWEAESFYEQAITEARENGFMFGEILCSELFAQFLLATARNARAKELISKVYKGYKALGADGKVNMVSKKYATLLYEPLPTDVTTLYQRSYPEEISATRIASFDVESIIKCSHILSSNMDPESLLVDGMQIIIENAGAEKGAILLIEGELYVHVERLANGTIEINKKSLTDWNGGCKSIISYVRRTLKPVIVGDASYQSEYSNDPYIRDNAVQSILCIPVLQRKALYAILYLQNDSVKFAFTQNHFDILVVLSSQLAISLKNANYLQKLKQSEENYRVLASASPVGLLRVNIRTNEILYMNDKASGMMGIDFQPNMLVNWKNYIFAEDHDLINQDWQHAVTHERHFKAEFRFQGQNQPVIWVISEAEPQCNDKGEIISYVMTITDISERKEIERLAAIEQEDKKQRELREQAKIFEDREKTYARHMYHELRNPLQGIMSSAESILFTLHKLVARETQPAFRLIEQPNIKDSLEQITGDAQAILLGAKHQQAVTDDALRAASLLEHAIKLEKQPVDVKGLLVDIILLYKRRCEGKGLLLNIDAPDENILIIADPLRLREVIINLVANAIKFTEHGGITLIVSYKNLNHNHIALTIIVKDTGIGMSESIQKKLFFPFAQASSSTHAKYGGTGLGLYIAKMTIELMQGNISVKSKEGEGSEFSITLECTRAKPEEVATSTATIYKAVPVKSPTEAKSILVVEDNTINRTVLKRTLEQEGYNCMAAENGQIALNMYNDLEQHFDMIFMDVEMPIMGGIEATQLIRKEEQEQGKIPVIIIGLSGNAQAEDIKTGLRVGMNEYLIKPIDRSNLRQCLERFFTTSPQAGPSQQRSSIAHP